MRNLRHSIALSAAAVTVVAGLTAVAPVRPALSLEPDFATIEAQENAANNKPGPRTVPGRAIPVPGTVSPQLQATIAAPYRIPAWDADPKSAAEWKDLITRLADAGAAARREAREKLGVTMEPTVIGGVKAFIVTPKEIPPENRNRLLVNVHGGGYVYGPGEAGTGEAVLMAAFGGYQGDRDRLPHAARLPLSGGDGRRDGGVARSGQDAEPAQHGDLRHLDRRRHDARHDPARQAGRPAAAGRDRARHAVVRPHRDRRHLQDQRVARQRAGQLQWLSRARGEALRRRT